MLFMFWWGRGGGVGYYDSHEWGTQKSNLGGLDKMQKEMKEGHGWILGSSSDEIFSNHILGILGLNYWGSPEWHRKKK